MQNFNVFVYKFFIQIVAVSIRLKERSTNIQTFYTNNFKTNQTKRNIDTNIYNYGLFGSSPRLKNILGCADFFFKRRSPLGTLSSFNENSDTQI